MFINFSFQTTGTTVAILVTLDPESQHPSSGGFTYTMTEIPPEFPFAIIGDRIIAHQRLNYEDTSFYYVHITTTDSGGLSFTKVQSDIMRYHKIKVISPLKVCLVGTQCVIM